MSPSGIEIRRGTWLDVILLIPRLRQADIDECEALFGRGTTPMIASETFRNSPLRYTVEEDGVVIAMFGVAAPSLLADSGHPWMFGSDAMDRAPRRAFIDAGRKYIADMLRFFPRLENIVDSRNEKSIRWLRRMGFILSPAIPMGPEGVPFHPFVMEV
jgi:hypothetical protein